MAADERERYWGPAVTKLCAHLGQPLPPPMTPEEEAAWERAEDEADAAAARLYGLDRPAAAA